MRLGILSVFLVLALNTFSQRPFGGLAVPAKNQFKYFGTKLPAPGVPYSNLPPAFTLNSKYIPLAGHQGTVQGSCTAWSISYGANTYCYNSTRNINSNINDSLIDEKSVCSPSFIFNITKSDPNCSAGIYL